MQYAIGGHVMILVAVIDFPPFSLTYYVAHSFGVCPLAVRWAVSVEMVLMFIG